MKPTSLKILGWFLIVTGILGIVLSPQLAFNAFTQCDSAIQDYLCCYTVDLPNYCRAAHFLSTLTTFAFLGLATYFCGVYLFVLSRSGLHRSKIKAASRFAPLRSH